MDKFFIPEDAEEQLEDRGYFVVRNILTDRAVAAVRRELERIIAEKPEGFGLDSSRTDNVDLDGADAVRAVGDRNLHSQVLWEEWLSSENVVALNRRFLGDDVRVQGTRFFTKPARLGEATPWHQDIWLWERDPSRGIREYKRRHFNCWVALEAADLENGCLHVMPGSHKGGVIEHVLYEDSLHPEIPRELLTGKTPEPVPLGPGGAVIWHSHMWHMSPPNPSDRTRWGGVMITFLDEMAEKANQADRGMLIRKGKACPYPGPIREFNSGRRLCAKL